VAFGPIVLVEEDFLGLVHRTDISPTNFAVFSVRHGKVF
jgi:hypothetical protein